MRTHRHGPLVAAVAAALVVLLSAVPSHAAGVPPVAPSDLTATYVAGVGVQLVWQDNATDETNYRIERCDRAVCTYSPVLQVGSNRMSVVDASAFVGADYSYRVFAVRNEIVQVVNSDYSNLAEVSTGDPVAAPSRVRAHSRGTTVTLSWRGSQSSGIEIYRCDDCADGTGTWQVVALLPAGGASRYSDGGLTAGTTYRYAIRSYVESQSAPVAPSVSDFVVTQLIAI